MALSGRPRVIVADDHPLILKTAAAILNRHCEVVAAFPSGAGVAEAAATFNPDVVVLDIAMPQVDGYETATQIRAGGSSMPIVFLSNHVGDDFILKALSVGASAFVPKPRMHSDLIEAIGHALDGRTFLPSPDVLPRWHHRDSQQHDLEIYGSDALLAAAVIDLFVNALSVGHSIFALATETHLQVFDERFRARGLDPGSLKSSGRYSTELATSAADAVLVDGKASRERLFELLDPIVDRALAASSASPPHVTMWGECAPTLLRRNRPDAALDIERFAGEYVASRPLSIVCGYSTESLSEHPGTLPHLCAEHSAFIPAR
jgi:CheY-like chemotaxis protein